MKKMILSVVLTIASLSALNAQEGLKGGAYLGIPSGNSTDYFGLNYGVFAAFHYPVFENLHLGATAGVDFFSGKDVPGTNQKFKGFTVLPIGVSGQFNLSDEFFATVDLGFALSLSKDYTGGFFFQPKGGWQNEFVQVFFFIKNISSELDTATEFKNFSSITSIGVGGAYKF
ncbi:MAG: hypothetical protein PHO74_00220 [Weeksellaceae bacterium]|jgi:hypothetical protein|nr:hypothetical protein [Weeksellaceae bacterium]